MKRIVLLLILAIVHTCNNAMDEQDIRFLLCRSDYSLEDVALTTFQPPYEDMNCIQSSLISGVKIGYNLLPFSPMLVFGTLSFVIGGPLHATCTSMALMYSLGYYQWDEHHKEAQQLSNKLARSYAPDEYAGHYAVCKAIKTNLEKEREKETAFQDFKKAKQQQHQEDMRAAFEELFESKKK